MHIAWIAPHTLHVIWKAVSNFGLHLEMRMHFITVLLYLDFGPSVAIEMAFGAH